MRIENANSTNAGMQTRMSQGTDTVSKSIQSQIKKLQQDMQKLSENDELDTETKMKKRQELQQQISDLNNQLRQHQLDRRRQQQSKAPSMEDMLGGRPRVRSKSHNGQGSAGKQAVGMSASGMQAIISADTSIKQADIQGSVATQMEGRAGVLEGEIKQDKVLGGNTKLKEEELAKTEQNAANATASQMGMLSDANAAMEAAREADSESSKTAENKDGKTDKIKSSKTAEAKNGKADESDRTKNNQNTVAASDNDGKAVHANDGTDATPKAATALPENYARVDIRL